jgi:hypothetical protein
MMKKNAMHSALTIALFGTALISGVAWAGKGSYTGPFGFTPIAGSAYNTIHNPAEPWIIPTGFEQTLVSGEQDLDVYNANDTAATTDPDGPNVNGEGYVNTFYNDWHDMNTVNESGPHTGRFLFRTHEVRGVAPGGAISVVDLKTGAANTLIIGAHSSNSGRPYDALDGIRWTPWGTMLFAEETTAGRLFEVVFTYDKNGIPNQASVYDRPAVGRLAHEGIDIDAEGNIYVVDEFRGQREGEGGGIYKFVPKKYGDLSEGELYVLTVLDNSDEEGLGYATWLGPIDPLNARTSGTEKGGVAYNRPEDLEVIGNTLYVAVTEGTYTAGNQNYDGRVLAINLETMIVSDFVKPGVNVSVESEGVTGFDNPDNLAETPDGKLVIIEDNIPSDIWIAQDDNKDGVADGVWLFASLTDPKAEGTGIYFGQDPHTMFVNIQHSVIDNGDGTWAISKVMPGKKK